MQAAILGAIVGQLLASGADGREAPPALYTRKQAEAGAVAYRQACASCHGPRLEGQLAGYSGPTLRGSDFADAGRDLDIDDVFRTITKRMPAAAPGTLAPEAYVRIMAFLLNQNGYPAGARELTYEVAATSAAPMRFYGK